MINKMGTVEGGGGCSKVASERWEWRRGKSERIKTNFLVAEGSVELLILCDDPIKKKHINLL